MTPNELNEIRDLVIEKCKKECIDDRFIMVAATEICRRYPAKEAMAMIDAVIEEVKRREV